MNRELVKESISQFEVAIDNLKQSLLEEDKPKHVIGNWYKYKDGSIFCVTSICERGVLYGYGFTDKGEWFNYSEASNGRCACNEVAKEFTTGANIKEVEEALIKESKRRYKVGCTIKALLHNKSQYVTLIIKNEKGNLYWDNTFYYGNYIVLNNGKWAEVIEQDKFAELKEALKNGTVIEYKKYDMMNEGVWDELKNGAFVDGIEYRIKPEEKPKVGDVCKFWDNDENSFFISVLTQIDESDLPYCSYTTWSYNAKPITQQEVINLLFNE